MEDIIGAILFVLVLGGVGYWLYSTGKGPFDKDD